MRLPELQICVIESARWCDAVSRCIGGPVGLTLFNWRGGGLACWRCSP